MIVGGRHCGLVEEGGTDGRGELCARPKISGNVELMRERRGDLGVEAMRLARRRRRLES